LSNLNQKDIILKNEISYIDKNITTIKQNDIQNNQISEKQNYNGLFNLIEMILNLIPLIKSIFIR
jgi:hypothetical protein